MQHQLQSLNKLEQSCDKKNKEELQSTLATIRNKVLIHDNHNKVMNIVKLEKITLSEGKE